MRINDNERPDKSRKDKEDIDPSQEIVLESELKRGEGEIKNEVENEWHCDHPRDLFCERFIKYGAE